MRGLVVGLMLLGITGCTQITERVIGMTVKDLERTSELAKAYNKPEVAQCSDFLLGSLSAEDQGLAQLQALLNEPTSGLASAALKAALIAEMTRGLDDPAKRAQWEADFQTNCQAVAGHIMMDILRDAKKFATRGN